MTAVRKKRPIGPAKPGKSVPPPHQAELLRWPDKRAILLGFLLAAATLALYFPVSGHPFANYDDDVYITYNARVQSGLHWDTVRWAFTSFDASNWHPLTWLSHALDCQLFQLNPGGHHETNSLLHAVNTVLLFWVLLQATGFRGRSFAVAALFAVHPINVETVAWIAERKNVLSMLFFLLALGTYRWYAARPQIQRYALVAFWYALGLMAKPQVITFPFVLLLWDYWPLGRMSLPPDETRPAPATGVVMQPRSLAWLLVEKLPLFALSAASAVVTTVAQRAAGATSGIQWHPFATRLENAVVAYVRYLGKAFWPSHLSPLYPHPGNSLKGWEAMAAGTGLLLITVWVLQQRRRRYLLVGWFWFLGTLVPMIGLVQVGVQAMADRYAYLPFVGLFIAVCWGVADLAQQHHVPLTWQGATTAAVLLSLAVVTHRQIDYWSDNVMLWSHALQVTTGNWVAENNLGHALLNVGQEEQAIQHFRAAVAINPIDPDSNLNIGAYEQQHKDLRGAIEQYEKVLSMTQDTVRLNAPRRAKAFSNMGLAYRALGDDARARENFEGAVKLDPNDAESWIMVGVLAQKAGDTGEAVQAYSQAVKIQPADWLYLLLARALQQSGQADEAKAAMDKAKLMSQNFEQTQRFADHVLALQPE